MIDHLISHHKAMASLHRRTAAGMDDSHEMKAFHAQAGEHHYALCKALEGTPDVADESRRGGAGDVATGNLDGTAGRKALGSDWVPTQVKGIYSTDNLRLVPRAGQEDLVKSARVSPELEDMFSI